MIHPDLHKNPVALDRQQHRLLRFKRDGNDLQRFAMLNSIFVLAGEFGEACKDYPLVWVEAGHDANGARQVAPVAVFGLGKGENLCIVGGAWRTAYVPIVLRLYPFALARSGAGQHAVCYDSSAPRFSLTDGESLFEADGTPSAFIADVQRQLEQVEVEVERTRQMGLELLRLELLRSMRFEATTPDGASVGVDGFLTLDEERISKLPDADVLALHKSGLLGIVHAHQVSLSNMRRLAQWHVQAKAENNPSPQVAPR
jgi:SapC